MTKGYVASGVAAVIALLLMATYLVGSWLDSSRSPDVRIDLLEWMGTPAFATAVLNICLSIGSSLFVAAIFLVGVQVVFERSRRATETDKLEKANTRILIGRARLGNADAKAAIAEMRATGTLVSGALVGSNLSAIDFSAADLSGANLTGCDFTDATLQNCTLASANLENSVMTNTNIDGANLTFAKLGGATIEPAQLSRAKALWRAVLPNGEVYDGQWNLSADIEIAKEYDVNIHDVVELANFYHGS